MTAQYSKHTVVMFNGVEISKNVEMVLRVKADDPDFVYLMPLVGTPRAVVIDGIAYYLTGLTRDGDVCEFTAKRA